MKTIHAFFISVFSIVVLSFTTVSYFKKLTRPITEAELPNFEMPDFNLLSSEETEDYTEFTSPDEKLKLKYPSNWVKANLDTLETINKSATDERVKNLLFVQGFKIDKGAFAFLNVQELILDKENGLEDVIDTIKKKTEDQGGEFEATNLEIDGNQAYVEQKYKTSQSSSFIYSKEKIVLGEDKAYLISISNFNNNWLELQKEINEIFNSIQYIN
jgi:hypothetical protein